MKLQSIAAIPACSEYAFQLSCLRKNRCPRSQFPEALQTHAVFPRESYGLIGKRAPLAAKWPVPDVSIRSYRLMEISLAASKESSSG